MEDIIYAQTKNSDIFIAGSSVGSYLLFSMAIIVCLVTSGFSAGSSCFPYRKIP